MVKRLETAPQEPASKGNCCHYWIIEPADGPTSKGMCQFCGAEKEFANCGPELWSGRERDALTPAQFSGSGSPAVATAEKQDDS
ncbi:MAG TPA: hypothetical protein VMX96_05820 [Dehalococcoidia bacterium]|nr:hypothetical protein [Dehalococcoidia bacterium]